MYERISRDGTYPTVLQDPFLLKLRAHQAVRAMYDGGRKSEREAVASLGEEERTAVANYLNKEADRFSLLVKRLREIKSPIQEAQLAFAARSFTGILSDAERDESLSLARKLEGINAKIDFFDSRCDSCGLAADWLK